MIRVLPILPHIELTYYFIALEGHRNGKQHDSFL